MYSDKLCEWRGPGVNVSVVDLAKTYIQIRVQDSLWPYQTVVFKGRRYCLMHLGFGLNTDPLAIYCAELCASTKPERETGDIGFH